MAENEGRIPERLPEIARPEKIKTSDPRDHYMELDALRGIAILGVVLFHLTSFWMAYVRVPLPLPLLREDALKLFHSTGWGVSLFFLLSGYLLTWTEEKRARSGAYSVRSYALRRMLRLVPAYYFAILVAIVVWPERASVMGVLLQMSFLQALNPYTGMALDPVWWSLTAEVVFYVLLPFLVVKLPRFSQRLTLFGALFVISLSTRMIIWHVAGQPLIQPDESGLLRYLYFLPTTWLWLFLAGVLLRMVVERLGARPMSRLRPLLASVLFLVSAFFLVTLPYLLGERAMKMPLDLMMVAFFASAVLGAPLLRGVLSWRPLVFVGVISYSLFLLHHAVIEVISRSFLDDVREWLVGRGDLAAWTIFLGYSSGVLAAAVAASYLSYRYIESPFLRHKPK